VLNVISKVNLLSWFDVSLQISVVARFLLRYTLDIYMFDILLDTVQ